MSARPITEDERALLTHVTMFGSAGYPVRRLGRGWVWGTDSVKGPPATYPTKREAVASFEAFLDVLLDAEAEAACRRAWVEQGLEGAALDRAVGLAGEVRAGRMAEAEFWGLLRAEGLVG